ncbi:alpha/beta-hydrolase [Violaceomyces palustris]|uniref:Alpha/beta-hydrolase n=1 Tax=Violaceomyces palustris TaxID=1673888 RepID=A0ACD0NRC4_9BASI|nr:alpha/beta-hydrolase [Violaceomyces palustris]
MTQDFTVEPLLSAALASPILDPRASDPVFTASVEEMKAAITCPDISSSSSSSSNPAEGGTVLLVPGTATTGSECFKDTPYVQLLPHQGRGYKVCWVDLPDHTLGDVQVAAEYVAFAIEHLSQQRRREQGSSAAKINVIGHSQGGLVVQWALNFWETKRELVEKFIGLAANFQGSLLSDLLCNSLEGVLGCPPAAYQQGKDSNLIKALNRHGGDQALVDTAAIYTYTDEALVYPGSASLPGATNLALQDAKICGKDHFVLHNTITTDAGAFRMVLDILENGSKKSIPEGPMSTEECSSFSDMIPEQSFKSVDLVDMLSDKIKENLRLLVGWVDHEPPLMPYAQ